MTKQENGYNSETHGLDYSRSDAHIWDSRHYPSRTAFSIMREEVCTQEGIIWAPTSSKDTVFEARNEYRFLESGIVYRCRHSNLDLERSRKEISQSTTDGYCVFFCLSGALTVCQDDDVRVVRPGDLSVLDLSYPLRISGAQRDAVGFYVPKSARPVFEKHFSGTRNSMVSGDMMSMRLRSCLNFLLDQSRSGPELNAVLEATIDLLPIDAGCFQPIDEETKEGGLYREIVSYLESRLDDPSLSARSVAVAFGISERHAHRVFARRGTTLGGVVQRLRLEGAAGELSRQRGRQITDVAFRWGFNDLSTFTRAFKRRFGQSPRKFQALG